MKAKLYNLRGDPINTINLKSDNPPLLLITKSIPIISVKYRYWNFSGYIREDGENHVAWYNEISSVETVTV
jgi:hypothetical protein